MAKNDYPWLDREQYPFRSSYFPVNGHRLHHIDEGKGEILLFVHGTPSWSFEYRHAIRQLKDSYRCIAIDHVGFGLSDKPEHYDYSTPNHSKTLEKFVVENDLRNITLVVHDFGGPIGLSFAIDHPDRIRRVVVLNSWLWSSEGEPEFVKLSRILKSPLIPWLYRYLNFSPRYVLPKSFGDIKPDRKTLNHYAKPFATPSQRNGALAFVRSLLQDQEWFEELWKKREVLTRKPCLFIWGMKDPILTPKYLEKFRGGFANACTVTLARSGHFPQEEQPDEVVQAIRAFMTTQ